MISFAEAKIGISRSARLIRICGGDLDAKIAQKVVYLKRGDFIALLPDTTIEVS